MNKILQEAADEISNVFTLNNGWCDDKRMAVSKILETVEAKILQTTNKQSTPNYACPKCGAWLSTNEYRTGECHSCCSAISA